jgi:hypothetical protein
MRFNIPGSYNRLSGPFPCDQCHQLSCFAEVTAKQNKIFCQNKYCNFSRTIDKSKQVIVENDGTFWHYNPETGAKVRITPR